jgi:LAS superfamily LD-carboxypeptidase LdcB
MKKIFTFLIFSCLLFNLIACKKKEKIDENLNQFKQEISTYQAYNPDYLYQYYETYQKSNSYIYALNAVNYPLFLFPNQVLKALNINDCLLVNRNFYLNENYVPYNLVPIENVNYVKRPNETMMIEKTVLEKYKEMEIFLKQKNINILLFSSFRSYAKQTSLWNNNNQTNNLYLAKPGFSEHQTGLAVDIGTKESGLTIHFENTKAFQVLKENAHLFGFILRYPKNKESITGYAYEPWHFRYVGTNIATIIYENNITLEEYFYYYFVLDF